jgi:UDPglucose 6-dehydrogenase
LVAEQPSAFTMLDAIYAPLKKDNLIIKMSNISAELTKYAANCFLATKISFMNEMAQLCEVIDANVEDVKKGIGSDPRSWALFSKSRTRIWW